MNNFKKSIIYFTALLILINVVSCSKKPKLQPISQDSVILAFGDSLTAGYGTTPENSYPSILEQISGHKIINAGISGETTSGGLARFATTLEETQPSLVILMEGGNDILQNQDTKVTTQNLIQMIKEAQARNIQVVLIGVPSKSIISTKVAEFYEEVAKQTNVVYDGKIIPSLIKKNELKSDLVHFNADGYHKMAEEFYKLLKDKGAFSK